MKLYKPNFWDENNVSIISILLYPISLILRFLFLIKSTVVKKTEFSIPIICVGNIYIGGTGKTPLAIKIFELVKKLQKKPIVIKKYYKNQFDETNLLSKFVDLSVSKSRIKAINDSLEKGFDVVVLDDGLQDMSIKKKLSIVCFNSNQLVGNGLLTFIDENTLLTDFFTNKEIVFYKNIHDLSYKLNKYKKDKKTGKRIAKKGKLKYLKYFNSDIISEYILSKSFDYKLKQKVIWE